VDGALVLAHPDHFICLEPGQQLTLAQPVHCRREAAGARQPARPGPTGQAGLGRAVATAEGLPSVEDEATAPADSGAAGAQLTIRQEVFKSESEPWQGLVLSVVDRRDRLVAEARTDAQGRVSIGVPAHGVYAFSYVDDSGGGAPRLLQRKMVQVHPDGTISAVAADVET
jgi:hypothetical protein